MILERWYQTEAINATWGQLMTPGGGNPLIVLPTGSGKTVVIASVCKTAVEQFAGRILVLAHRKELLQQSAEKIQALLPGRPVGIYSAGLRRFAMDDDIIVAGIQSVYKKALAFGRRHLVIIDENHLIPSDGEGMYRTFLDELASVNPKLKLMGLTATPYRTGEGSIARPDGLFQRITYEAKVADLIRDGFLCPVTSDVANASVDTSKLHIRGGEFIASEMEHLFDTSDNVSSACLEIVAKLHDRRSIMVFCAGVQHARDVADRIELLTGERVGVVTGESSSLERGAFIADFKAQRLRWLCNVGVLTIGFDAPCTDAIAMVRATASPGLFAQIVGRGMRLHSGKANCAVLDFGQNAARFGPIDSPEYGKNSGRRGVGGTFEISEDDLGKACPGCGEKVATNTRICPCGFKFPVNHQETADASQIISAPQKFNVVGVNMARHKKRSADENAPNTLRVDYTCESATAESDPEIKCHACDTINLLWGDSKACTSGPHKRELRCKSCDEHLQWVKANISEVRISEWVCLEHPHGFARTKASLWWTARSKAVLEDDSLEETYIDAAIDLWKRGAVATPLQITAMRDGHFWRISQVVLDEVPEDWQPVQEAYDGPVNEWGEPMGIEELPF